MNTQTISPTTLIIDTLPHPVFPGAILPKWVAAAEAKGFDIVGRIIDRLHLALRCRLCGATQKVRLFTLMSAQPLCQSCLLAEWRKDAEAAGLTFLRRDPAHRHYAFYLAPCGHEVRRQFELVRRIGAGVTGFRCETCHAATETGEAQTRGWCLTSADPEGNPNYRVYTHSDCGHDQRIVRANMQSGRFSCGGCGEDWPGAASYVYAMGFTLASGREVVKLGFSRDPDSRLTYQLRRDSEMPCQILRVVPMATGHTALCAEKAMHKWLRQAHPDAAVDPHAWRGQIRVKTEIYDGSLTPVILGLLDDLEASATVA
ncbi:GIY-YIG nuclease family protein [Roseovarius sp.]|uniref:GIY-YIG nuclease family protein n=1 Tax=Roseovarius sp. TaxID=1486281 RepID=UPI0025D41E18|nr:GIY-YIG nuclease family protein [Roseovarius sp.]